MPVLEASRLWPTGRLHSERLANGLQVLLLENEQAPVVEIVDDVHNDVLSGPAEGGIHVQIGFRGKVEQALDEILTELDNKDIPF